MHFVTCTTDEETTTFILPSIYQLNPEVNGSFLSYQAVDRPIRVQSSLLSPSNIEKSAISSEVASDSKHPLSPFHSENGQSSKASSDSEDEKTLQTPASATASLSSEFRLKEENDHNKHTYICPFTGCGWSFKRYEHLKRHQLVHTKERPYVCEYSGCGKSFSRSDNYSAHYRTHQRRRNLVDTHPFTPTDIKRNESQLYHRRSSLAIGDEIQVPKINMETLDLSTLNNVEEPLLSHSKTSNIHKLLNESESSSYHKRRFSEHSIVTSQDSIQEQSNKSPNRGRSERRHSVAIMTSIPTNFGISHSDGPPSSHTLPPTVLQHLYPHSYLNTHLLAHTQPLLPNHSYLHPNSQGQPHAFLPNHFSHAIVSAPLATIEESPQYHIPTTITAPRISSTKNHVCAVAGCNMRFKRLEHLKRHILVHTLERPFACTYIGCHKTFSRRDNLRQHMRTHERQPLKQVQNTTVLPSPTIRSISTELGISHTGHVRQRSM